MSREEPWCHIWAKALRRLKRKQLRLCVLVEGVDGAGKTSLCRFLARDANPKQVYTVALDCPTRHEQGQWFMQRWLAHLPRTGQVALYDRSWYTRPLLEGVYGWCPPEAVTQACETIPVIERLLVQDGLLLVKLWLSIDQPTQQRRLAARKRHPLKRWKYSVADAQAGTYWQNLMMAKEHVFEQTECLGAHWRVVNANDKRIVRREVLRYLCAVLGGGGASDDAICRDSSSRQPCSSHSLTQITDSHYSVGDEFCGCLNLLPVLRWAGCIGEH